MSESYTVSFPTWALTYLVNGDSSGLNEEEVQMVDQWVDDNPGIHSVDPDGGSYFSGHPEFGLASDCEDLTVTII